MTLGRGRTDTGEAKHDLNIFVVNLQDQEYLDSPENMVLVTETLTRGPFDKV